MSALEGLDLDLLLALLLGVILGVLGATAMVVATIRTFAEEIAHEVTAVRHLLQNEAERLRAPGGPGAPGAP